MYFSNSTAKSVDFARQDTLVEATEKVHECVQKIVVKEEKTSSALIIMGLFFIVVVIGLFYYLPHWTPARSSKCINNGLRQTDSQNSRADPDSLLDADNGQTLKMHSDNSITFVLDEPDPEDDNISRAD